MFVCGWNKNGQLGLSVVDAMVLTLSPVPSLTERVQKVSCGWNHTLALLENGHVVACGCNTFGQLGVPEIEKQTNKFTAVSPEVSKYKGTNYLLRYELQVFSLLPFTSQSPKVSNTDYTNLKSWF